MPQLVIDSSVAVKWFVVEPFSNEALKILDQYRNGAIGNARKRTVYDSLYLALSLREGCQFVTADEKFANAVGSSFPSIVWLANWT